MLTQPGLDAVDVPATVSNAVAKLDNLILDSCPSSLHFVTLRAMERTLVIVKPDGVQRGLIGEIIGRLEARGLKLVGLKLMPVSKRLAEEHYAIHRGKPFYDGLIDYITSAPVVVAAFEGKDATAVVRSAVGATNPAEAVPGTIRGDLALEIGRNLVHASDGPETADQEVSLWFRESELISWERQTDRWIFE
jgi:nucleoside-diphosphate kinase